MINFSFIAVDFPLSLLTLVGFFVSIICDCIKIIMLVVFWIDNYEGSFTGYRSAYNHQKGLQPQELCWEDLMIF